MLKCIWLSEKSLSDICRHLDSIWDRTRSEILYDWAYSLKDCCSLLNIEHLNFTTKVDDEFKITHMPESRFLEPVTNLKLKALKNKLLENEDRSESYSEERLRRRKFRPSRQRKLLGNFKYETPKDSEILIVESNSLQLKGIPTLKVENFPSARLYKPIFCKFNINSFFTRDTCALHCSKIITAMKEI